MNPDHSHHQSPVQATRVSDPNISLKTHETEPDLESIRWMMQSGLGNWRKAKCSVVYSLSWGGEVRRGRRLFTVICNEVYLRPLISVSSPVLCFEFILGQ